MKPFFTFLLVISSTAVFGQDRFRVLPVLHPGTLTVMNDSNMTWTGEVAIVYKQDTFYCKSFRIKNYLLTDLYGVRQVTGKGFATLSDHLQINDTNKWVGFKAPPYPCN